MVIDISGYPLQSTTYPRPSMPATLLKRIAAGRTDLVFDYCRSGKPSDTDASGVPLIRLCAYYGDVAAVRYLISKGESLDSLGTNYDLNGAVFHGHWQLCEYLIEHGADVNRPLDESGETPLHVALTHPRRPVYDIIVELLLQYGADPMARTIPGRESGCFMRDSRTKGETPLHRAAAFGSLKSIRMLVDAGADVEAADSYGDTPLSWASWHLRPDEIIRSLCFGAYSVHPDRNSQSDHGLGWSALETYLTGKPLK